MLNFEIHITGDSRISNAFYEEQIPFISIDNLSPTLEAIDRQVLCKIHFKECSVEKMYLWLFNDLLPRISKYSNYVTRVKIETEFIEHLVDSSKYLEIHYKINNSKLGNYNGYISTSSNDYGWCKQSKPDELYITYREYDKSKYGDFIKNHSGKIEMCIFDSNSKLDEEWFNSYE